MNGETASLGDGADPETDRIELDGERIRLETHRYYVVNKPRGVLSTARDPEGRRTVVDLVRERRARLFPVGRLDRDTEGLVLLTNDGALTHALLHPSHQVEREYRVTVRGELPERARRKLERGGVNLEDGRMAPAQVAKLHFDAASDTTTFHLTMIEGRKRQIRRALRALGHPVRSLTRVRMGPLRLGRLPSGAARPLSAAERAELERIREGSEGSGGAQAGRRSRSKGGSRKRKRGPGRGPA